MEKFAIKKETRVTTRHSQGALAEKKSRHVSTHTVVRLGVVGTLLFVVVALREEVRVDRRGVVERVRIYAHATREGTTHSQCLATKPSSW